MSNPGISKFCFFFFVFIFGCNSHLLSDKNPPNVILIMTDDQGWGDLGFHGNDSIYIPNIDQLARNSARFERFYVSPVCAPTRASLLTGRYHLRTGTSWVTHRKEVMRQQEITIAELLKREGYSTGCFGKWHNGEQYPNDPIGQGFDTFVGFKAGHWNNYFNTTLSHDEESLETSGFITDVLTDAAIQFMEENQNDPFFCYIPYNAPHSPFQLPNKYFDKYKVLGLTDKNASVYGMVENIDKNIGRIISAADSMQLTEQTIIIFLSDNGPNGNRYNGNMRGIKGSVHEGGVRVPCFISWKGHLEENIEIPQIAAHIDILPTLLELCAIKPADEAKIDGKSLVPLLRSTQQNWPDRYLYNIHTEDEFRMYPASVRSEQFRMVTDYQGNAQLFDLKNDPSEEKDLSIQMPGLFQKMQTALQEWFDDVTKEGIQPPPIQLGIQRKAKTTLPAHEAKLSGNLAFQCKKGWANDYILSGFRFIFKLCLISFSMLFQDLSC
jgi:arylsulfatase A